MTFISPTLQILGPPAFPLLRLQGFPTILFFPAEEDADPIPFDGQRTLAGMTKFLKEKAKIPFELPKKKKKVGWCAV